jgi:tubby-related protein 1
MGNLVTYVNRPPKWNSVLEAYVLNFYGRVEKPSVKNFQLIEEGKEDSIILQFGRIGTEVFNLDFQFPISPL